MSKTTKAKAWAALVIQGIGQAVTLGVLPQSWLPYAEAIFSAATILGVYGIKNRPIPSTI